jgi:hydroxymethylpyrimidine pyrophosphatase-like HAD family hydrolase
MIRIEAPGRETQGIESIVFDLNGTLTLDGRIHPKTKDKINLLAKRTTIYVMTADTRGDSHDVLRRVKSEIFLIEGNDTGE